MANRMRLTAAVTAVVGAFAVAGCGGGDPQSGDGANGTSETIVIGSQDTYSSEIIAEVYAQALEEAGYKVDRQMRIGQREVYLPEIEAGEIDLFPEYTGNLLQYWVPNTQARQSEEVYEELYEATPEGLRVLDQASATDQDSYTVTKEFADEWGLSTIDDLTKVTEPMVLGGNSELAERPYGPRGLEETYGVQVGFTPIEDSGGPLTLKALEDGDIQLANVYTANPAFEDGNLVVLTDTKGLFVASHVVPVASANVDDGAVAIINEVNAELTPEELVAMNARSVNEELPASTIAREWLSARGL